MKRQTRPNTKYHAPPDALVAAAELRVLNVAARSLRSGSIFLNHMMVVLAFTGLSFAGPKLAPDLPGDPNATVDVIIQFKTPPTKQELKRLGPYGQMKKIFHGINAVNLQLP